MTEGGRNDLVSVDLEAVVVAVTDGRPRVLTVGPDDAPRLPAGALDARSDASLDLAMRRVIGDQADLGVEYLEQLYTFGNLDRLGPRDPDEPRTIGVGYLVLTREAATTGRWVNMHDLFPWEDRRRATHDDDAGDGGGAHGRDEVRRQAVARLSAWAVGDERRTRTVQASWGLGAMPWDPVRALERYEVLYEARLVPEWWVDHDCVRPDDVAAVGGMPLAGDHRRVVATALSRLRGKLTYRPLVFDLLDPEFTLTTLKRTVEALVGQRLHTQNFRRMVDRAGLVEGVGRMAETGGRPAELHRFRPDVLTERPTAGLLHR